MDWFPEHGYEIIKIDSQTTEEDESDTYSAYHIIKVRPKTDEDAIKDEVVEEEPVEEIETEDEFVPDDEY